MSSFGIVMPTCRQTRFHRWVRVLCDSADLHEAGQALDACTVQAHCAPLVHHDGAKCVFIETDRRTKNVSTINEHTYSKSRRSIRHASIPFLSQFHLDAWIDAFQLPCSCTLAWHTNLPNKVSDEMSMSSKRNSTKNCKWFKRRSYIPAKNL